LHLIRKYLATTSFHQQNEPFVECFFSRRGVDVDAASGVGATRTTGAAGACRGAAPDVSVGARVLAEASTSANVEVAHALHP
jgi:hypothetical protein